MARALEWPELHRKVKWNTWLMSGKRILSEEKTWICELRTSWEHGLMCIMEEDEYND